MPWPVGGMALRTLALVALAASHLSASAKPERFKEIDRVEGWTIERRLTEDQQPICRASIAQGGTWFSARVRLDEDRGLLTPEGLEPPEDIEALDSVRQALERCRSSLLYLGL